MLNNKETDIDLSYFQLNGGDCTGIDFSRIRLSGTSFYHCNFTDATLTPITYDNVNPLSSNWWDAAKISKEVLEIFVTRYYPGYYEHESLSAHKDFNRDYYIKRIAHLCKAVGGECSDGELKFIDTNFTVQALE